MWILAWLPDSVLLYFIYSALGIGGLITILSVFLINPILRWFPVLAAYYKIIQYLGVILLGMGIYFYGSYATEMSWRQRVSDMEEKVRVAEEKSKESNKQLENKVVEKTKIIREKGEVRIEYINRLVEGKTTEIVKDMSAEERAEFERKQQELLDAIKNCPVPRIIVEEHNKAAELK
jgi:membrane protein implicated in regulation of membrane protease activity